MIRSMTAFTRQQQHTEWGQLTLEIRSVNHRYLDTTFRLPHTLLALESDLRDTLRCALSRGKIDVTLTLGIEGSSEHIALNHDRLRQLNAALTAIQDEVEGVRAPDALAILNYPGVVCDTQPSERHIAAATLALFEKGLTDLIDAREREGERINSMLTERLDAIDDQVAHVRTLMPTIIDRQRTLLKERIEAAHAEIDEQRLAGEIALLAQKADVEEELDRLSSHVVEVRDQLKQSQPVGRRLDFLMQELNREANTLSSKSVVADTTKCAVELKVLIEQMREQVQNVE